MNNFEIQYIFQASSLSVLFGITKGPCLEDTLPTSAPAGDSGSRLGSVPVGEPRIAVEPAAGGNNMSWEQWRSRVPQNLEACRTVFRQLQKSSLKTSNSPQSERSLKFEAHENWKDAGLFIAPLCDEILWGELGMAPRQKLCRPSDPFWLATSSSSQGINENTGRFVKYAKVLSYIGVHLDLGLWDAWLSKRFNKKHGNVTFDRVSFEVTPVKSAHVRIIVIWTANCQLGKISPVTLQPHNRIIQNLFLPGNWAMECAKITFFRKGNSSKRIQPSQSLRPGYCCTTSADPLSETPDDDWGATWRLLAGVDKKTPKGFHVFMARIRTL